MKKIIFALCVTFVLAGCNQEQDPEEARYCEMVSRWKLDAAAGIQPKHRTGWPPYKGECN